MADPVTQYRLPLFLRVASGPDVEIGALDVTSSSDVVMDLSEALREVADAMRQQREREIRNAARRRELAQAQVARIAPPVTVVRPQAGAHGT
jgi:hypothetical protein